MIACQELSHGGWDCSRLQIAGYRQADVLSPAWRQDRRDSRRLARRHRGL